MLLSAHARIPTAWSHPADGLYRATTTHLTLTYRRNMRLLTPAKVRRGGWKSQVGGEMVMTKEDVQQLSGYRRRAMASDDPSGVQ